MGGGERRQLSLKATIERYLREARAGKLFIYQKYTKEWFSPDDFEKHAELLAGSRLSADELVNHYVLRDPKDGMIERVLYLEKIVKEFKTFAAKVNSGAVKRQQ